MIVRGKERLCADALFISGIFQNGAGNGHAVKCRRTASDLIKDEQAVRRRVLQDLRDLRHLHHERGLAGGQIVRGSDAREDAVHHADARRARRDEAAHLRHQHNESNLPHIGGFTGHIRAGQNGNAVRAAVERRVVRDEQRILEHLLHDGMAAVCDMQLAGEVDLRAAVILPGGQRRKIRQHVQRGHGARRALDAGGLVGQMLAHL